MADFCWDCVPRMFGFPPERNDLVYRDLGEDRMHSAICEGCGIGWFDRYGRRVKFPDETERRDLDHSDGTDQVAGIDSEGISSPDEN